MIANKSDDTIWGAHSYGVMVTNGADVRVGRFCSIAKGVMALVYADHRTEWITTYPFGKLWGAHIVEKDVKGQDKVIEIENDVWIGTEAILLEGTVIHNGAVIGSHAVVHGEIPPYTVAVGNPARVVKQRFSDKQIEALLKIQWWNWPTEKINEYVPLLCSSNIDAFIKKAQGDN